MARQPWNHNIAYHDWILRAVPPHCDRALDVGCGQGLLASSLAGRCKEVIGIDLHPPGAAHGFAFIKGDVMSHPPAGSFDLITAVASLHHLPLRPALSRLRELLRPGGVLAVIGLYRSHTLTDYLWPAAAFPASWILRLGRSFADVGAPVQEPRETLAEIRAACAELLPGVDIRRRLFFRYSLFWRKP